MSQVYGQSTLPLVEHENNLSLYALQSNLLRIWTQKKVDKYYQTAMLAYMDNLQQEQAKKEIIRQHQRMLENKSQYNIIKQYINHREEVLDLLQQTLEDENQIQDACQGLDELRKINLKLCQCIFAMKQSLQNRGLNSNAICQGYNQLFKNLNHENANIVNSYLRKYISFGKGFDPFFLVPYQRIQKNGINEQTPKCVTKLFKMNISYVYRLIKCKNQIIKCLSCACLTQQQATTNQEKYRPKPRRLKQPIQDQQEEQSSKIQNKSQTFENQRQRQKNNKSKLKKPKGAISQPQNSKQSPLKIVREKDRENKKQKNGQNNSKQKQGIKLPKIQERRFSSERATSGLTVKRKIGYDQGNGPLLGRSPIERQKQKQTQQSDDEIDSYRKKIIAKRIKIKSYKNPINVLENQKDNKSRPKDESKQKTSLVQRKLSGKKYSLPKQLKPIKNGEKQKPTLNAKPMQKQKQKYRVRDRDRDGDKVKEKEKEMEESQRKQKQKYRNSERQLLDLPYKQKFIKNSLKMRQQNQQIKNNSINDDQSNKKDSQNQNLTSEQDQTESPSQKNNTIDYQSFYSRDPRKLQKEKKKKLMNKHKYRDPSEYADLESERAYQRYQQRGKETKNMQKQKKQSYPQTRRNYLPKKMQKYEESDEEVWHNNYNDSEMYSQSGYNSINNMSDHQRKLHIGGSNALPPHQSRLHAYNGTHPDCQVCVRSALVQAQYEKNIKPSFRSNSYHPGYSKNYGSPRYMEPHSERSYENIGNKSLSPVNGGSNGYGYEDKGGDSNPQRRSNYNGNAQPNNKTANTYSNNRYPEQNDNRKYNASSELNNSNNSNNFAKINNNGRDYDSNDYSINQRYNDEGNSPSNMNPNNSNNSPYSNNNNNNNRNNQDFQKNNPTHENRQNRNNYDPNNNQYNSNSNSNMNRPGDGSRDQTKHKDSYPNDGYKPNTPHGNGNTFNPNAYRNSIDNSKDPGNYNNNASSYNKNGNDINNNANNTNRAPNIYDNNPYSTNNNNANGSNNNNGPNNSNNGSNHTNNASNNKNNSNDTNNKDNSNNSNNKDNSNNSNNRNPSTNANTSSPSKINIIESSTSSKNRHPSNTTNPSYDNVNDINHTNNNTNNNTNKNVNNNSSNSSNLSPNLNQNLNSNTANSHSPKLNQNPNENPNKNTITHPSTDTNKKNNPTFPSNPTGPSNNTNSLNANSKPNNPNPNSNEEKKINNNTGSEQKNRTTSDPKTADINTNTNKSNLNNNEKSNNPQTNLNQNQMKSSASSPTKRQIQLKPHQTQLPDLYNFIDTQKISNINRTQFQVGQWRENIKNKHSYLTKFFCNSQLSAFGISSPRIDGDYHILYWGVIADSPNGFLFKKYIEYLEKFTSLDKIYINSNGYNDMQFVKQGPDFMRKRSIFNKKQLGYQPFLSIECSNIHFNEKSQMSHSTFYSEQIQDFKEAITQTSVCIGLAEGEKVKQKLPSCTKLYTKLENIGKVNNILEQIQADTYAANEEIATGQCKLIVIKDNLTIKKNQFYVRDGYFMTKGYMIYEHNINNGANKNVIYRLELEKQGMYMYFGKKFSTIHQFTTHCSFKAGGPEKNFAFKMFTKQLYGRMKNPQYHQKGCYGNWDIDFIWQDQLKGTIIKPMPESNSIFGPQNYFIAIYKVEMLLYGFQVNSNDFLL